MNIREIKKAIIEDQQIHSSELIDYINQRLERRNNPTYRRRLFSLINPVLNTMDYEIFYCDYHEEIECDQRINITRTGNGDLICRDAYQNDYFTCDDCEEVYHMDDQHSFDYRSNVYCDSCYDNNSSYCDDCETSHHCDDDCDCSNHHEEREESNLDEWDTINPLHFLGKETSTKFEGVEIEMQVYERESRSEIVDMFRNCFNQEKTNIICKRDGSLHTEKGFEMSSTNASFKIHKEEFWNDFFKLNPAQYVKAYNGYQCGIHIHTNRNYFSENNLRALNCFYNNPKNRKLIVDIAGRDENSYCRFIPSITFDDPIITRGSDENGRDFKYRVINFKKRDTVEVRIFRSNLKQISFFRYLEFAHTVCLWIKDHNPTQYEKITWVEYFDWLLKNIHKDYSNLLLFLDDKKHFDHLENIQEWQTVYTNFKTVVHNFRNNNQELIEQEREE